MGFFSWDCKCCGKSIRSPYSVDEKTAWMNDAVVISPNGEVIKGEYDGYGRIESSLGEVELDGMEACMYHEKCWNEAGKPMEYSPSNYARDQGFFVED